MENPHGNIHIFQIKVKTSTGYSISNRLHGDNKETIKKMEEQESQYEKEYRGYGNRRYLPVKWL